MTARRKDTMTLEEYHALETEEDFQTWVIKRAWIEGWMVAHFRPGRTVQGWRTTMVGDVGFVDLVLARAGVVLLVELKSDRKGAVLAPAQEAWAKAIGAQWRLWRPSMRAEIERELAA